MVAPAAQRVLLDRTTSRKPVIGNSEHGGRLSAPTQSRDGHGWPAALAGRVADGAAVEQVADAILDMWREVDRALVPIVGPRGVAALYNRSVKLTVAGYPWLADCHQGALDAMDPTSLKAALLQQGGAQAASAGNALFQSFHILLASLVGDSLTERLLRPVWVHSSGATPAQDDSP